VTPNTDNRCAEVLLLPQFLYDKHQNYVDYKSHPARSFYIIYNVGYVRWEVAHISVNCNKKNCEEDISLTLTRITNVLTNANFIF
jgi:hypothetical protein